MCVCVCTHAFVCELCMFLSVFMRFLNEEGRAYFLPLQSHFKLKKKSWTTNIRTEKLQGWTLLTLWSHDRLWLLILTNTNWPCWVFYQFLCKQRFVYFLGDARNTLARSLEGILFEGNGEKKKTEHKKSKLAERKYEESSRFHHSDIKFCLGFCGLVNLIGVDLAIGKKESRNRDRILQPVTFIAQIPMFKCSHFNLNQKDWNNVCVLSVHIYRLHR